MCDFESKIYNGLLKCGINLKEQKSITLGAAVSGGADSIALLVSLANLLSNSNIQLYVITVNHNIRPSEETDGDAQFVYSLCNELSAVGKKVSCKIVELKRGLVNEYAERRNQGIEDAARFLRYKAFDDFITENNLDYLCLAHNKNDQLETLLMRFLQGAGNESSGGISSVRGKILRPMLEIERNEIEEYLISQKISWRTDSTNLETEYLRNKIRLKLVPFLDKEFAGWKNALITGGKKAVLENQTLESLVHQIPYKKEKEGYSAKISDLQNENEIIISRFITSLMNLSGEKQRIPYVFLEDIVHEIKNNKAFIKRFNGTELQCKKEILFVKKAEKQHTDLVFFDIIEETGKYLFPFGGVEVLSIDDKGKAELIINDSVSIKVPVPFCIRNIQFDDEVKCADGSFKKLSDVYSDWQVEEKHRELIPVIKLICEKQQPVIAVIGSVCGYKDWIIK